MDIRVWGVVEDRLIEVRVAPAASDAGLQIDGLPRQRARTTADRIRAALINSGLPADVPPLNIRLEPAVRGPTTSEIDLPIALAVLARAELMPVKLRWILATGRLGLAGEVFGHRLIEPVSLADVLKTLCRTPVVKSERMFEEGSM